MRAQPGAPTSARTPGGQRGHGAVAEARAPETWSPLTLL